VIFFFYDMARDLELDAFMRGDFFLFSFVYGSAELELDELQVEKSALC